MDVRSSRVSSQHGVIVDAHREQARSYNEVKP